MERKPWYPQGTTTRRVISMPGGKWCSQVRVHENGKKDEDNWESTHAPTDFETACKQTSYRV